MHYFWPTSPLTQPGHAAAPPNALFPTRRLAAAGVGQRTRRTRTTCAGRRCWLFGADRTELVPTANVACGLTAAQLWNPVTNPTGERCGITDFMRAVFGVTVTPDAPNGKGRVAIDNVGVQYGLSALQRGEITPEQFADLNAKVGGMDIDGNFVAQRTAADPEALRIALRDRAASTAGPARRRSRRSTTAPAAQSDDTGFHPAVHSFSYRARLDRSNGDHDNQVIWLSRTGGVVPDQFDADARAGCDTGRQARGRARRLLHGRRRARPT